MRIVIVSNRLPVSITKDKINNNKFQKSAGGLATSIGAYTEKITELSYTWVGWPGIGTTIKSEQDEITNSLQNIHCYPVFLTEKEMDKFYLGFCNRTIWPLFHYFPTIASFEKEYYNMYKSVNLKFAKALSNIINENEDIVWVHDYHLMLLPSLLRQSYPTLAIGFFLHIPFPAYEVFQLLPSQWRIEIIEGLLGADLIGFHTHEYTDNFLRATLRFAGLENHLGVINNKGRLVKVGTHPISIDYLKFSKTAKSPSVISKTQEIKNQFKNKKILFSVDRLDYTKGILNRLLGFEYFLDKYPAWRESITLIIVVVPSRIGVFHYQQMKKQIDETIGRINGKFSTVEWTPIVYKFGSLDFENLVSFYSASDIMLVTPLRDGMNLVAKEFIASKQEKNGVLILSEMAGSAKELLEALIINPNSIEEIGEAIKKALDMSKEEQSQRIEKMQERISRYNVFRWVSDYLNELNKTTLLQKQMESQFINQSIENQIISEYAKAKKRLIMLDYDGTLIDFVNSPKEAVPTKELIHLIHRLTQENNTIVIVSGRDKDTLQQWFENLNIAIVAEHGAFYKYPNSNWKLYQNNIDKSWKNAIINILKLYSDRLPGSFIENKTFSIVFHYRNTDPQTQSTFIPELNGHLQNFVANTNLKVHKGNKILEIKPANIGKHCVAEIFNLKSYDFMLAIGDDYTDEDMFKALPENAITIKVGEISTLAKYNIKSPQHVIKLLEKLINTTVS
ncbi:bifunctional alpha,alpha-trehalose-phosphate synthase (UDP-forming)/trehalose-phosphatase [Desulfurella multipotens]|uniref:bifunctional alpha,alpha-trehalose-phosphate synthase (UDP-forming)/trehalose-phosphatase n=1 Tax=Desulfurella TaxID=33001 RepID=UPI000CB40266|nr:bifunctional alpha,alpha-trehalose-phosphate synthase (UDP-forming)/trehalose-phosphatase [Desulfurella multipotens]PMP69344.1 MAG: bifunctional alpha,alpha-trehalose-phosphate synthase (UDP-forming)/trehalose-phosphatase [Desulfurella multipotens]